MKTLHLSTITGSLIAGIVLMTSIYIIQMNPPVELQVKSLIQPQNYTIEYYSNMTNEITVKPLQTQVIPVQIFAPQDKSLHIKLGVTVPNNEGHFITSGDNKLPFGIFASLDKKEIDLPATSASGTSIRDTAKISIFTLPFLPHGNYRLALMSYHDDGAGYSTYITIRVD
jgi:hypothetical protein